MKVRDITSLLAACMLCACETSTTVRAVARLGAPLDASCLARVAAQSYGEKAVRKIGTAPLPIGVNLSSSGETSRFADIRQEPSPDGGVFLEIAAAWWGKKPHDLVSITKRQEVKLLRAMLAKCAATGGVNAASIECTLAQGRNLEPGCGD